MSDVCPFELSTRPNNLPTYTRVPGRCVSSVSFHLHLVPWHLPTTHQHDTYLTSTTSAVTRMTDLQTPRLGAKPLRARVPLSRPPPLPALGARDDNLPGSSGDSPSRSVLSPSAGGVKLKIKSATTPEARSRVLVKPRTGVAGTPLPRPPRQPQFVEDDWVGGGEAPAHGAVLARLETPALAPHENVLVSIR
jgi:hypothetical protein